MRLMTVTLATLIATPAFAITLCTTPAGKTYAGTNPPPDCVVKSKYDDPELPPQTSPRHDPPGAPAVNITINNEINSAPATSSHSDPVDTSLDHLPPGERARLLRNREIDAQIEAKNQAELERDHEIDKELIRGRAKVQAAKEAARSRRAVVVAP